MDALAQQSGRAAAKSHPNYLEVGGVCAGPATANSLVTHAIRCPTVAGSSVEGTSTVPEIDSDKIPALLGLKSFTCVHCVMDMVNKRAMLSGPGGIEIAALLELLCILWSRLTVDTC